MGMDGTIDPGDASLQETPIYQKPKLTIFGSLRDLTRTGVGNLVGDNTSPYNVANQS
jgi:hypothetical protein